MVKLTNLETIVYKALNSAAFASGINSEGNDAQTDLKDALKECAAHLVSPSSFAGALGSLAKKGLYQHVPYSRSEGYMPHKAVLVNGKVEIVRSDIGSVIDQVSEVSEVSEVS
jgi:hypothetical protein